MPALPIPLPPRPLYQEGEDFNAFWQLYLLSLLPGARQIILRQDRFFEAYALTGTMTDAARASDVIIGTAWSWQERDTHFFRHRLAEAREIFADSLEKIGLERLKTPSGNRGSDLLLMAYLNAHRPEKWRPNAPPQNDTAKELLARLMEVTKGRKRLRLTTTTTDTLEVEAEANGEAEA